MRHQSTGFTLRMRSIWLCVVLLGVPPCGGACADVQTVLDRESAALGTQLYRRAEQDLIAQFASGERKATAIQLTSGVLNAVVVACDESCDGIEVSLFNAEHQLLTSDQRQSLVIINGNPAYTGLHQLEVAVSGCRLETCEIGLAILRQETSVAEKPKEASLKATPENEPKEPTEKPAKKADRPKAAPEKARAAHDPGCAPFPNESYWHMRRRWARCSS